LGGSTAEGYSGKDLQKRKVLSRDWKSERVMDDESGESMELMEEVPLKELGESHTHTHTHIRLTALCPGLEKSVHG